MAEPPTQAADVLTIFGITGDLAKKMTFRALYRLEARGKLDCPIVGVAIDDWTVEKPFGHDLESARKLNAELCEVLREDQILRIDHYLGKEPVMDISYMRFANSILEPVWNREHVSHVQMTIAEDFGVEDRGRFYDA